MLRINIARTMVRLRKDTQIQWDINRLMNQGLSTE